MTTKLQLFHTLPGQVLQSIPAAHTPAEARQIVREMNKRARQNREARAREEAALDAELATMEANAGSPIAARGAGVRRATGLNPTAVYAEQNRPRDQQASPPRAPASPRRPSLEDLAKSYYGSVGAAGLVAHTILPTTPRGAR